MVTDYLNTLWCVLIEYSVPDYIYKVWTLCEIAITGPLHVGSLFNQHKRTVPLLPDCALGLMQMILLTPKFLDGIIYGRDDGCLAFQTVVL